jgi:GNAT superfamily N-acetyltransferase
VNAAATLRPATAADVGTVLGFVRALAEYEKLSHLCVATEADFLQCLFGPRPLAHAVIAETEKNPVGMALWHYTLSTFAGRPILFVEDVFVQPTHRGHGIGLALFRHMARVAATEACVGMEWRVLNWNQPALDFYARIGAKPITDWTTQQLRGAALSALAA